MQHNLSWYILWLLDEQQCKTYDNVRVYFDNNLTKYTYNLKIFIYGILRLQLIEIAICNSVGDQETCKVMSLIYIINACNRETHSARIRHIRMSRYGA